MSTALIRSRIPIAKYCTKPTGDYEICTKSKEDEPQRKSITEKFTDAIRLGKEVKKQLKERAALPREGTSRLVKPIDGYTPRFQYNGYLRNCHWRYYSEDLPNEKKEETEEQFNYRMLKKQKYCLLLGFVGANYYGMQYNESVRTIEDELLKAMVKQKWILPEHLEKPYMVQFSRGSRTDRGVSAARMNLSVVLRKCVMGISPCN